MEIAQESKPNQAAVYGRHVVGMALFALVSPLIYSDPNPLFVWLTGWAMALAVAAVLFGVYALFFGGKSPTVPLLLAWAFVVLYAIGGWSEYRTEMATQKAQSSNPFDDPNFGMELLKKK